MKINIHISTYIFLLLAFFSGYFEYMYLFLITIVIHEYGHLLFALLVGIKNPIIHIYPFGGITILNTDLNISIYKELISLLGGIVFELLFFFIIYKFYNYGFITTHVYEIIKRINYILISFNFMPILPLDGGKLLNIIFDIIFPYKLSLKISICISIIFSIIFLFIDFSLFRLLLFIFLVKSLYLEIKNINIKYNNFLFERYINNYNFKNIRFIKNINCFKRDNIHFINNVYEKNYLSILFDKKGRNMLEY